MLSNAVILTLGPLVWLLIAYLPMLNNGTNTFGSSAGAGLGAIYYIPLLIFWPLVACLYTYFFRRTGHIYTGAFVVTLFMVWVLAAFGDFAVTP